MTADPNAEGLADASVGAAGSPFPTPPDPHEPLAGVAGEVDRFLASFLPQQCSAFVELDSALAPLGDELSALLASGGKRLRPAFVYWGHRATGAAHDGGLIYPATAVELFHAFALIHDDVMDRSGERHGRPTAHRAMRDYHRQAGLQGDSEWFGVGAAVVIGDLAFAWADELMDRAPLTPAAMRRARQVFTQLGTEVIGGQYLDLRLAGLSNAGETDALGVALLKSGRYTATRPLQLGACLGGADETLQAALATYGDAAGVAFQLRDDVLGLFGDPSDTGKAIADDLREGKRTPLVLRALELASPAGHRLLETALGDPTLDEVAIARVREVVVDSGALAAIENKLSDCEQQAYAALTPLTEPAHTALSRLAEFAAWRSQ